MVLMGIPVIFVDISCAFWYVFGKFQMFLLVSSCPACSMHHHHLLHSSDITSVKLINVVGVKLLKLVKGLYAFCIFSDCDDPAQVPCVC